MMDIQSLLAAAKASSGGVAVPQSNAAQILASIAQQSRGQRQAAPTPSPFEGVADSYIKGATLAKQQAFQDKQLEAQRQHETTMQESKQSHETTMQDDQQEFSGEQAGKQRTWMSGESALDRSLRKTERELDRGQADKFHADDKVFKQASQEFAKDRAEMDDYYRRYENEVKDIALSNDEADKAERLKIAKDNLEIVKSEHGINMLEKQATLLQKMAEDKAYPPAKQAEMRRRAAEAQVSAAEAQTGHTKALTAQIENAKITPEGRAVLASPTLEGIENLKTEDERSEVMKIASIRQEMEGRADRSKKNLENIIGTASIDPKAFPPDVVARAATSLGSVPKELQPTVDQARLQTARIVNEALPKYDGSLEQLQDIMAKADVANIDSARRSKIEDILVQKHLDTLNPRAGNVGDYASVEAQQEAAKAGIERFNEWKRLHGKKGVVPVPSDGWNKSKLWKAFKPME